MRLCWVGVTRFLPSSVMSRHAQRQQRAVGRVGELHVHHAVGRVHERGEVLHAVLDPLHRAARLPREQRADAGDRRAGACCRSRRRCRGRRGGCATAGTPSDGGQDRDGEPRPLVVGPELEAVRARVVGGHGAEGLQRRGGIALDGEALAEHAVRARHRAVHVAVGERVVPHHVGAELRDRGAVAPGLSASSGSTTGGKRLVGDGDALERVLGGGAIHRRDGGHGLADEARAVDREAVVRDTRAVVGMSGRMGPERRAASAPVSTAATPGRAAAALASTTTMRACACGLRSMAAWSRPGAPRSSMKRPRPATRRRSSFSGSGAPTQGPLTRGVLGGGTRAAPAAAATARTMLT